ncbi:fungal family protein [Schizosaccharomyces octosporus yFS286]|uniref:Fungal family protein n=1 Tax=Schizosaccharomyces octosporus (strain yFS286) TaxID=483514 RepID=S9PSQ4_SCHOY|nr:fungal family protein [Schizosaccharomyces octosporus yFS286]EPX72166.1 fungal family protein [Schizosaccharomyces octosporus yFS286]
MEQEKDASVLSNQFQASIGVSRKLINSWLGEGSQSIDDDSTNDNTNLQARPTRLGLGATAKESSTSPQVAFKNERMKSLPAALRKNIERQLQKKEPVKTNGEQSPQKRKRETDEKGKLKEDDVADESEDEDEDSRIQVANKSKRNINQGSGFDLYKRLNKRK